MNPIQWRFNTSTLLPGDIIHKRSATLLGWTIRTAISSWGNHDALVLPWFYVGDARGGGPAVKTHIHEYEREMARGECEVRVYRPLNATPALGLAAAQWWEENILGKPYDYMAYPRLIAKALTFDLLPWPVGWQWAWYCTEGCRDAWRAVGLDPYHKNNPTPGTTEKRLVEGRLVDVTDKVMIASRPPQSTAQSAVATKRNAAPVATALCAVSSNKNAPPVATALCAVSPTQPPDAPGCPRNRASILSPLHPSGGGKAFCNGMQSFCNGTPSAAPKKPETRLMPRLKGCLK
jgi:hypothetical protein